MVTICLAVVYLYLFIGKDRIATRDPGARPTFHALKVGILKDDVLNNRHFAAVTHVATNEDLLLARVLGYSLIKHNPTLDRIAYVEQKYLGSNTARCLLESAGWNVVSFAETKPLYNDKRERLAGGFELDLLKASLYNLTRYGGIVYLGPYTLVTGSLLEILEQHFHSAFALDVSPEGVAALTDPSFFLLRPDSTTALNLPSLIRERVSFSDSKPLGFSPLAMTLFPSSFRVPYKYNLKLEFAYLPDELAKIWKKAIVLNFGSEKPDGKLRKPSNDRYKPFFEKWYETHDLMLASNRSGRTC